MNEPTKKQEEALHEFLHSAIVPLIEDVLVKKLGQAMSYAKEQLVQPNREWVGLTDEDEQQCRIKAGAAYVRHKNSIRGQMISPADEYEWHLIRAIEAKLKEKNT